MQILHGYGRHADTLAYNFLSPGGVYQVASPSRTCASGWVHVTNNSYYNIL
jgi:hypothetical protein